MAENTSFVTSFLRGVVSEESYRTLVSNLYFVYTALEDVAEHLKDNDQVSPILFDELKRHRSLADDLDYFYGEGWHETIYPSDATKVYIERMREVARQEPHLFIGHHYTRYMGDLSGGQVLKGIAKKSLKIGDEAFNFYEFKDTPHAVAFKNNYRGTLNCLPLTQTEVDGIITEANHAFRLNMHMFEELAGSAPKTMLQIIATLFGDFISEMIVSKRFR
jgi:heme oxygenase